MNILLVIVSLLNTIETFHSQKIPILDYNITPSNILLTEYELKDGKLEKVSINLKKKSIRLYGHFYFAQLTNF